MSNLSVPCNFRILRPPDGRDILDETFLVTAFDAVNEIWAQANINIDLVKMATVDEGVSGRMYDYIRQKVAKPDKTSQPALLGYSTFWQLGPGQKDPNGFSRAETNAFAVKTYPSLSAVPLVTKFTSSNIIARVISHEIGHLLGLVGDGNLADYGAPSSRRDELMFSGTNGTKLTHEQITVARGVAATLAP